MVKMAPAPLVLDGLRLHPAVEEWFLGQFPEGPTSAQAAGWPLVQSGSDVLIAAPTGSGKTLAGFLMAIDDAYRAHEGGEDIAGRTRVVYVSPLKALAVDVHQNLERPLLGIAAAAGRIGLVPAPITVAVRTGDTSASARAAMVKGPPTILVTTPESLYLYLTAQRSRETLRQVRTVIVDEVHALARDKRGSHLALTLERLEHVQKEGRPQRVGLSATQKPIEATARLLSGANAVPVVQVSDDLGGAGAPRATGSTDATDATDALPNDAPSALGGATEVKVVDCGHRRKMSVSIELPSQELAAVLSQEQMAEVVGQIAAHVKEHRTTLVFVNTRRLSERLAHLLGEVLGPEQVAAHHGSLSAARRKLTETRLRAGDLRALVATASLELGIDIGPVELVCQVGSPRAISTFLQRVGRSNHSRHGVPEGILFPTTRDELVECTALLAAVQKGRLDAVLPPIAPLDILAQQVVAEVSAAGEWGEKALYDLIKRSAPYGELSWDDFEEVVELASEGIPTGRGLRMAFLHRDRVNGVLRPKRSARLASLTSGGAIPEVGDYRVVAEPDDMFVGSVNEDFAIESMTGDVFLLGTHAWRIRRVTAGEVRVVDAEGARPTIPFWVGEAPSRTIELSEEVSKLRQNIAGQLGAGGTARAVSDLRQIPGVDEAAALQVIAYLSTGLAQLGVLPTQEHVVFERFFDDAGGMQLVVHSPYGGRVNRGLGLALRKRFCVTFDFELQAAANDDAVILSLGPQHSFPLSSAPKLLHPNTVKATLEQAVLASPMFTSRWRWDLSRALAILRFRGGKKNPLPVQRMEADDLMAAVFPALAACQENAPPGPIELPDHVIVRQVLEDCLHEAMDVEGLRELVAKLHSGQVQAHFVDSVEPSVLSHEIVNSEPYTYLDDAPLEERRSRQVQLRRGLPVEARDLSHLGAAALERVRGEAAPSPRDAEELHELLLSSLVQTPRDDWREWHDQLKVSGRAMDLSVGALGDGGPPVTANCRVEAKPAGRLFWCATERREWVEAIYPGCLYEPDFRLPAPDGSRDTGRDGASDLGNDVGGLGTDEEGVGPARSGVDADEALALLVRGHLELSGPVTAAALAADLALPETRVLVGLARLEAEGFAMRGHFDPSAASAQQWCARHLLARIHSYSQNRLRREIKPVTPQEFMKFLARWQHVAEGTRLQGRAGVLAVIEQLQGWELAAGAWEEAIFPARVEGYQRRWLEDLCVSGEVTWGRLSPRTQGADVPSRRGAMTPSRATPVTFMLRPDLPWLVAAKRGAVAPEEPPHGPARDVLDALRGNGAMFSSDLPGVTGRLPAEVQEGLWDLVARGMVTSDGFAAVRLLFSRRKDWARRHLPERRRPGLGSSVVARRPLRQSGEGRWALLGPGAGAAGAAFPRDELAEQLASQLLSRWGVVFWDLGSHEDLALPWREVLWALRRFEARGIARGGRFVTGFAGEQYALAEALEELRHISKSERRAQPVRLSAADPLNLSGVVLAGRRIAALRTNSIVLNDGLIVPADGRSPTARRTEEQQPDEKEEAVRA
ncbi:MAG TPA: DEAD/DEAH box helicase [Acidimicrobiales bacterium]|nr:DEAD/DEAH box helicase [Acidimicrobiales bacterium]